MVVPAGMVGQDHLLRHGGAGSFAGLVEHLLSKN